jgi:hypothetical protein
MSQNVKFALIAVAAAAAMIYAYNNFAPVTKVLSKKAP